MGVCNTPLREKRDCKVEEGGAIRLKVGVNEIGAEKKLCYRMMVLISFRELFILNKKK